MLFPHSWWPCLSIKVICPLKKDALPLKWNHSCLALSMATPSFFNDHCPCVWMALPSAWMSKTLAADSQCLFCLNGFAIATKGYAYFVNGFGLRNGTISRALPAMVWRLSLYWKTVLPFRSSASLPCKKGSPSFFIFINFSVKFDTYSLIPMIRMKLGKGTEPIQSLKQHT